MVSGFQMQLSVTIAMQPGRLLPLLSESDKCLLLALDGVNVRKIWS